MLPCGHISVSLKDLQGLLWCLASSQVLSEAQPSTPPGLREPLPGCFCLFGWLVFFLFLKFLSKPGILKIQDLSRLEENKQERVRARPGHAVL